MKNVNLQVVTGESSGNETELAQIQLERIDPKKPVVNSKKTNFDLLFEMENMLNYLNVLKIIRTDKDSEIKLLQMRINYFKKNDGLLTGN